MGYKKIVAYGNMVEYYQYERDINEFALTKAQATRRTRNEMSPDSEQDYLREKKKRRSDTVNRRSIAFKRLVIANLSECAYPVLITFTHQDNIIDSRVAGKNFNSFARIARSVWGKQVRYIAVPERQKRGSIHFHALFWGIPQSERVVGEERQTRVVAKMWKRGFVDMIITDGNEKISTYLSKYMAKAFVDDSLFSIKTYFTSRNIIRPVVLTDFESVGYILPDFVGDNYTCEEKYFMTDWLGKGRVTRFKKV